MRVALALAAALAAGPALAAEPAPDAPVATAAGAPPLSTADQIDAFIRSSPAHEVAGARAVDGVVAGDDRQVHGEVSVAVGTHGYRSLYARTDMPVGQTGRLSIAVEDSRYDGRFGGHYGARGVGASLAFGDGVAQRCGLDTVSLPRPLDAMGDPNGRCVRPPGAW